ncbi:MAG: hypothetical protein AAB352_02880 [Patescibacteria group bacterium]
MKNLETNPSYPDEFLNPDQNPFEKREDNPYEILKRGREEMIDASKKIKDKK